MTQLTHGGLVGRFGRGLREHIALQKHQTALVTLFLLALSFPALGGLHSARAPTVEPVPHLWLSIDPGTYVGDHGDPWLEDSYVDPIDYEPNGEYLAELTILNRGGETTNAYFLIAIPEDTTGDWFAVVEMDGGAAGLQSYDVGDFARTDFNPYLGPLDPPEDPQKGRTASHGVYPPSGNAIWATYWVGNLAGRDLPGDSAMVSVRLVLGPDPSELFRIHWDGYSLKPSTGELQYWVPPSHDATGADDSLLALPPPIQVVDVSGNANRIAVGAGTTVSLFDTFAPEPMRLLWTVNTGLSVEAVAVCDSGDYVAVAVNELPLTGTSRASIHLYRSSDHVLLRNIELDHNVFRATRSLDISGDCRYVAVGTGNWEVGGTEVCADLTLFRAGSVFLVGNPDLVPLTSKQHPLTLDCAMGVRFSGNGVFLMVTKFWSADLKGINIYDIPGGLPWGPRAQGGYQGDAWYALAASLDGTHFSTGQGQSRQVKMWSFDPGTNNVVQLWNQAEGGTHWRQSLSNSAAYLVTLSARDRAGEVSGFSLYQTTPRSLRWFSLATTDYPASVELSVSNSLWAVGVDGDSLQLWGNGINVPPPGPAPSYQHITSGTTTDAAISHAGRIAVGSDDGGFLYVIDTGLLGGPGILWTWQTT